MFNYQRFTELVIDPHFEEKHSSSISDELIIELVKKLDGKFIFPEKVSAPFSYFVEDKVEHSGKLYKLIWLTEDKQIYIGVVNAYRRK